MGDDLVDLMVKPKAVLDNALSAMTKKAATTFWGQFKKQLSTASEPFFRKDMGERYFGRDALTGGIIIWTTATIVALAFPYFRSRAPLLCYYLKLYSLIQYMQHWLVPLLAGCALVFFYWQFGMKSIRLMEKYRAEGTAYHTRSRGTARWGGNGIFVGIAITIGLFLFDLPAGIMFIASCYMSSKIASEQQAAIYARYLDALDKKIEDEYLKDAMLGKCPTEITQLHKPLPAKLNADLRENIASAAVGGSVKILAKGPVRGGASSQPAGNVVQSDPMKFDVKPQPKAEPSFHATPVNPQPASNPVQPAAPAATETKSSKKPLIGIVIAVLAVAACTAIHFWPTQPQEIVGWASPRPTPVQPSQAQVVSTPSTPDNPSSQNLTKQSSPVATTSAVAEDPPSGPTQPPPTPSTVQPTPPVDATGTALAALEKERHEEQERLAHDRQSTIDQFNTTLAGKVAEFDKFKSGNESRLDENTNKIAKLSWGHRSSLRRQNDRARSLFNSSMENQQKALGLLQDAIKSFDSNPGADPGDMLETLGVYNSVTDEIHQHVESTLARMDDAISNAAAK